ncbi:hypothetical protein BCF44_101889 [Kutzneria buriramensis]|uniref:Uncharacterized protein n=1 Tax=Kutzneria buriramensis TaxID=1045776 RepID=A0A3E0IAV1_9PSEU|nr:hypothetical protein BCF44_101889 [Kutzneria buriramensis]
MVAARRRAKPRDQYDCPRCGGRHRYGSQAGRECGRTRRSTIYVPPVPTLQTVRIKQPRQSQSVGKSPTVASSQRSSGSPRPGGHLSQRQVRREQAKRTLALSGLDVNNELLTYVFNRDGFYAGLAGRLLDHVPLWHRGRKRGHWLCLRLNDLAKSVDPGTYAAQIRKSTRAGLIALGAPRFMANVLGAGAGLGLKIALGHTPIAHLTNTLRVLIPLVCPNLGQCPAQKDVVKTLATPFLAEQLKKTASA